jgi:DNA-binding NtrC family response regulator
MPHLLHIDDQLEICQLVRLNFSRLAPEFTVDTALTAREGLACLARGGYDLVLLDLILPDMDGVAVLNELALRGDATPVVMVSSHGQNDLAVRALRAGAADCVDKNSPDFSQLPRLAQRLVARRDSIRRGTGLEIFHGPGRKAVVMVGGDPQLWMEIEQHFLARAVHLELEVVGTPADFLQRLEGPVDAVLIAPHLQAPHPVELVRLARSRAPGTPVLVLAVQGEAETVAALFKLGVHDFLLQRPGYLAELVSSLNRALRPEAGPAPMNSSAAGG